MNTVLLAPVSNLTSPKSWGSRLAIKGQISNIWSKYGNFIKSSSKESGIPEAILIAFIAVESGGNPSAGSGNTKNLFQFNTSYVNEQLKNEFLSKRLSPVEKSKLSAYGFNFDEKGNTKTFTNADALKPELAILVGSIIVAQLFDQPFGKTDGMLRLDKVITVYNSGLYSRWSKIAIASKSTNAKQLHDELSGNSVTQSYIAKILGLNGAIDIINNDLVNTIV